MALISYQRWLAVAHPFKYRKETLKKIGMKLLLTYTFSLIAAIGIVYYVNTDAANAWVMNTIEYKLVRITKSVPHIVNEEELFFYLVCLKICERTLDMKKSFGVVLTIRFIIPVMFATTFSCMGILRLWRLDSIGESNSVERAKCVKRKRAIRTILVMSGASILLVSPSQLYYAVLASGGEIRGVCDFHYKLYAITHILLNLQFTVNPIICWCMNENFRQGVKSVCKLMWTKTCCNCSLGKSWGFLKSGDQSGSFE